MRDQLTVLLGLLTPEEGQTISTAVTWQDRETLAEVFRANGGHLAWVDDHTYAALIAVARFGAARTLTSSPPNLVSPSEETSLRAEGLNIRGWDYLSGRRTGGLPALEAPHDAIGDAEAG